MKRKTLPGDPAQGLSLGAHRVLSGEKHRILNRDNDKPSGSGACNTALQLPEPGIRQVGGNTPLDADHSGHVASGV